MKVIPLTPETPALVLHRHVKSGRFYHVITDDAKDENTEIPVVVYQSLHDGSIWVRPKEQFEDGRFEVVAPAEDSQ